MPRQRCAVCNKTSGSGTSSYFYRIPFDDANRLHQWQNGVGCTFVEGKDSHVCDKHFTADQFCPGNSLFRSMVATPMKPQLIPLGYPTVRCPLLVPNPSAGPSHMMVATQRFPVPIGPAAVSSSSAPSHLLQVPPLIQVPCILPSSSETSNSACMTSFSTPQKKSLGSFNPEISPVPHEKSDETSRKRTSSLNLQTTPSKSPRLSENEESFSSILSVPVRGDPLDVTWRESFASTEEDTTTEECEIIDEEETVNNVKLALVELEQILKLLDKCNKCGRKNDVNMTRKGAMISFHCRCSKGHNYLWRTSQCVDRKPLINTRLSAAALCSGVPYNAFERFFQSLEAAAVGKSSFYEHIDKYCNPVIKHAWYHLRKAILKSAKDSPNSRVVGGDARYDSPGQCAKYCHYSLIDVCTNFILDFVILQRGVFTGEMESKAFKFLFTRLLTQIGQETVRVFVSDRNLSVGKVMKDFFKSVQHAFDVWHLAKSLGKKLKKLSSKFPILGSWRKAIINHLWFSAATCGEDVNELLSTWKSMLYHVQNIHEWEDENGEMKSCKHGPLTEDQQEWTDWVDDVDALEALKKATQNTRFINQLKQCRFFVHTGNLESFHNLCLVYAPKRIGYRDYEGFLVRTILAVLDHNYNVGREVDGEKMKFSKGAGDYCMANTYESKDQSWRQELVQKCVDFVTNPTLLGSDGEMAEINKLLMPFEIPKTMAQVEKPSVEELKSRRVQRGMT